MLTLYKAHSSDGSDIKAVVPPGQIYLAKRHGKLVMVRQKTPKVVDIAVDLMGEVFESKSGSARRASKTINQSNKIPLLIANSQNIAQPQVALTPSQPPPLMQLLQSPYANPSPQIYAQNLMQMPQYPPQYPVQYSPPPQTHCSHCSHPTPPSPWPQSQPVPQSYSIPPSKPTKQDLEDLRDIDANYNEINEKNKTSKHKRISSGASDDIVEPGSPKADGVGLGIHTSKTTITIKKRVCANCGKIRSRKYHRDHPIKAGEIPDAAFCGKCQKDASSTGGSDDDKGPRNRSGFKSATVTTLLSDNDGFNKDDIIVVEEEIPRHKSKKNRKKKPADEYIIVEEEGGQNPRSNSARPRRSDSNLERPPKTVNENWKPDSRLSKKSSLQPRAYSRLQTLSSSNLAGSESSFASTTSSRNPRRRVERVPTAPWETPHVIRPRPTDGKVVIKETFVYRKKKDPEEQRRGQEYAEKVAWDERFMREKEEASRFYQDAWVNDSPAYFRDELPPQDFRRGRYRRHENRDSEYADSESSDFMRAQEAVFYDLPRRTRTPSPPSILRRSRRRSDEASYESNQRDDRENPQQADASTEHAVIISPNRSRSDWRHYDDEEFSDITQRERMAESDVKRVTFQSPSPSPSYESVRSGYDRSGRQNDSVDSFLLKPTSWDGSNLRGPT